MRRSDTLGACWLTSTHLAPPTILNLTHPFHLDRKKEGFDVVIRAKTAFSPEINMGRNRYTLHDCLERLGFQMELGGRTWSEKAKNFHKSIGDIVKQNPEYDLTKDATQFTARTASWIEANGKRGFF